MRKQWNFIAFRGTTEGEVSMKTEIVFIDEETLTPEEWGEASDGQADE